MLSIEDKISMEVQAYLKLNKNKDAVYFYDHKLRGSNEYSFKTSRYGEVGVIIESTKSVKSGNRLIKVFKYNFTYI